MMKNINQKLKKILALVGSRLFYFILGLSFVFTIYAAHAAWNTTVTTGTALTPTLWNDLVARVSTCFNIDNITYFYNITNTTYTTPSSFNLCLLTGFTGDGRESMQNCYASKNSNGTWSLAAWLGRGFGDSMSCHYACF